MYLHFQVCQPLHSTVNMLPIFLFNKSASSKMSMTPLLFIQWKKQHSMFDNAVGKYFLAKWLVPCHHCGCTVTTIVGQVINEFEWIVFSFVLVLRTIIFFTLYSITGVIHIWWRIQQTIQSLYNSYTITQLNVRMVPFTANHHITVN